MSRFLAFGALLTFPLLSACSSYPDVPNKTTITVDEGGSTRPGDDSGPPNINVEGGTTDASNPDADLTEAGPVCGDGVIDAPETCDDGNATPGDGCDGNCQTEPNWVCTTPGQPCTSSGTTGVCGNSIIEGSETCDLGKAANDGTQGCDANCKTVAGWTCPATGGACTRDAYCGDGSVQTTLGEQCDDGTNDGAHGCSPTCQVVVGWKCPPKGGSCSLDIYCGNGIIDGSEQCDDHNRRSYDGCSATCFIESGWSCPPTGGVCSRVCGNGAIDSGETCDDGNFYSGDGCSSACQTEAKYTCSTPGQPCVYTPPPPDAVCGNGLLETGETCDDGNASGGDGCSATCQLESGWKCPTVGAACVAAKCGDAILAGGEQCDDGIVDNAHGCSTTCTIEPNAVCPANGGPCIPMKCGDGKVTGTEQCDDGTNDGKHGCSKTCQQIAGWECPLAGTQCIPICGDGIVVGDEQCDEQGAAPCCTASCKLNPGYVCDPSKNPHSQSATLYCGNNVVDGPSNPTNPVRGSEQCDDHNTLPFDGCSPTCTNEPLCGTVNTSLPLVQQKTVAFQCFPQCGDGIVLYPEQCDDGNTEVGDGCDASCQIELNPNTGLPAWDCSQAPPADTITLPVVWRDFSPRTHPQFSVDPIVNRRLPGIVGPTLAQVAGSASRPYKYVPVYNTGFASPTFGGSQTNKLDWTLNGPGWVSGTDAVLTASNAATLNTGNATLLLTPAGRFAQWYVDDSTVNISFASTLTLTKLGLPTSTTFQYSCAGGGTCDSSAAFGTTDGFFPLDGKGWVAQAKEDVRFGHNFSFTTETRYWFAFAGNEQLSFYGDDDVWVFVNGQLALDIGGIHSQTNGEFTLSSAGVATVCVENIPGDGGSNPAGATPNCSTLDLGLKQKTVYEIDVFNAERHVSGSNFRLTLEGFNGAPTVCTPKCGDGYIVGNEQCDRGAQNVAPSGNTYGLCTTSCQLGPYCGDDKVQSAQELCDNGLNIDSYSKTKPTNVMCAPGCVDPLFCGDGILQKVDGETCDDGAANQNSYGHCQTNCQLGARCGDGSVQAGNGEVCDDGANNGAASSACDTNCQKKCGNGTKDPGEACDDGANNGVGADTCDKNCNATCGNGQLDPGEQCDDGKNDGSYGTCTYPGCQFAPYCGDKVVQNPPEACDNGSANSSTAYGPGSCTDQCLPGGTCGDGLINGNEKCDDGNNTGAAGSCTTDCSAYVPPTNCGDGVIQAPEKCDDGKAKNGVGSDPCGAFCRLTCGNGTLDSGEQCDNGANDGSYGTCTSTCQLAGYCGDGIKNGTEQCDNGSNNVAPAMAYGVGVCTTACRAAPFCGDGRVQTQFGEQCEGVDLCLNCSSTGPK